MAHPHASWGVKSKQDFLLWNNGESESFKLSNPTNTEDILSPSRAAGNNDREDACAWCGQVGVGENGVRGHIDGSGTGPQKLFCSDICFSQCRRAAFKRAKVCDWCKHVRHSVTYVDLHDGQRQLQFCTDKCRNQYKMQLFCAETSSLGVQSCSSSGLGGNTPGVPIDLNKSTHGLLITPELWLADCRADDPAHVKPEYNDDGEAGSNDSDLDGNSIISDTPLNLVHSSRQKGWLANKRQNVDEDKEVPQAPSKKGKSHRKPSSASCYKTIQQPQANSPLQEPIRYIPHHLTNNIWPAFPYPQHLPPHSSYFLQSRLLALNQSIQRIDTPSILKDGCPIPAATPNDEDIVDKSKSSENVIKKRGEGGPGRSESSSNVTNEATDKLLLDKVGLAAGITLPSNFVVLKVPTLVPLPIPVPIPIPIHEKYFKQMLT